MKNFNMSQQSLLLIVTITSMQMTHHCGKQRVIHCTLTNYPYKNTSTYDIQNVLTLTTVVAYLQYRNQRNLTPISRKSSVLYSTCQNSWHNESLSRRQH